jgi:hypothetical protein
VTAHASSEGDVVPALNPALRTGTFVGTDSTSYHGTRSGADGRTAPAADGGSEAGAEGGSYDGCSDRRVVGSFSLSRDMLTGVVLAGDFVLLVDLERFSGTWARGDIRSHRGGHTATQRRGCGSQKRNGLQFHVVVLHV